MPRLAYVNGRYVPHREAAVSIDDRGYQFSDGVYEVLAVVDGRPADEVPHFERLGRSLAELQIAWPVEPLVLTMLCRRLTRLNNVRYGMVYVQITRGVALRAHDFASDMRPQLVITARSTKPVPAAKLERGIAVITAPDQRWARRDIKSISLLANILAKHAATETGAGEAWQVTDQGIVTEGSSSNAYIVTRDGVIRTHPAGHGILNGVIRLAIIEEARRLGLSLLEQPFSVEEAYGAEEAFITSTTQLVVPVTSIDSRPVGRGSPGPIARALRAAVIARGLGEVVER